MNIAARIDTLKRDGKSGSQIAEQLRDEGEDILSVRNALSAGYLARVRDDGRTLELLNRPFSSHGTSVEFEGFFSSALVKQVVWP